MRVQLTLAGCGLWLLAACTPEPPPRTVVEFIEDPRLLEATMVRCAENRAELKYTAECQNAREAIDRISAREESARRAELEAQSKRKREALRRAQEAAAQARAQAEEAERQRREAEYLGQFGPGPDAEAAADGVDVGEAPVTPGGTEVVVPGDAAGNDATPETVPPDQAIAGDTEQPEPADTASLEAVREELRRRQQGDGQ